MISCRNCSAPLSPDARFCAACGAPAARASPADDERHERLAAARPEPLAERLRTARVTGERKPVTAVFADIVGSTGLAESLDPEAWAEIVTGALDAMSRAVFRYEGTVAQLLGDGMLALFGAPIAHEDDPERAVRAALEMVAAVDEYGARLRGTNGIDLRIRVGANTGLVVVGNVGGDLRYDYTAIGDTMNVAARMQAAADPGTVRVTAATRRLLGDAFEVRDLGSIAVKGKAEPVHAYEVVRTRTRTGWVRGLPGLASPLIGRDRELEALRASLAAIDTGDGRAALIVGEPGIGKSRLLRELRGGSATAAGARWVEGRCLSYGRGLPYHLILDLVRGLLGLQPTADEVAATGAIDGAIREAPTSDGERGVYLRHLLALHLEATDRERLSRLDPDVLQSRYRESIGALIQDASRRGPIVLVCEDIHWADASSVETLTHLLPMLVEMRLLLIVTSRSDPDSPIGPLRQAIRAAYETGTLDLTLSALTADESRELVARLLEIESLPAQVRETILAKSEGNPYFVEEVIRMLIDRAVIVRRGDVWVAAGGIETVDIPDTLHGLLLARIDRLPEDAKRALRVASVIGRQFRARVLDEILAEPSR